MSSIPSSFLKNLSQEQCKIIDVYPPPQLFAVISWGAAATLWLSHVLNMHPEIFCVHAMNIIWDKLQKKRIPNFSSQLDGLEYLRIVSTLGTGCQVAGDVHGISGRQVPYLREILGEKFNAVVVIRDPIRRLKSQIALFQKFVKFKSYNINYVKKIIKDKKISIPDNNYENKLFIHGVNMLNTIKDEVNLGKIFKMEDLVSDTSSLKSLIHEISKEKLTIDDELLSKMISKKSVNPHKANEIEFSTWQISVIKNVVDEKSWDLYSKFGYKKPDFIQ